MGKAICFCIRCFDPREKRFGLQHGTDADPSVIEKATDAGMPKDHNLFAEKGRKPLGLAQSHNDCLAVKTLLDSLDKHPADLTKSEREYHDTHAAVVKAVKLATCNKPRNVQLQILQKVVAVQSANLFLKVASEESGMDPYEPGCLIYFSHSRPFTAEEADDFSKIRLTKPEDLLLEVFDPVQNHFVVGPQAHTGIGVNEGIRLVDLRDSALGDRLKIRSPVDIATVIRNELALAGRATPMLTIPGRATGSLRRTVVTAAATL